MGIEILRLFTIAFTHLGGVQKLSYVGSKVLAYVSTGLKIIFIGVIIKLFEFLALFIILAPFFILPEINEFYIKVLEIFKNKKWSDYISLKKIFFQSIFIFLIGFLGYLMVRLEVFMLINLISVVITPLVFWYIIFRDEIHIKIKDLKSKLKEKWLEFCIDWMLRWIVLVILRLILIYICLILNSFFPNNSLIDFYFLATSILNTSILKALFSVFILEYLSFDLILGYFGFRLLSYKGIAFISPNYPFLDINRPQAEINAINNAKEKLLNYLLSKIPYDVQRIKIRDTEFRHLLNNPAVFDLKGYALSLEYMLNLSFDRNVERLLVMANNGLQLHPIKYNNLRFVRPISFPGQVTVFLYHGQSTHSNAVNSLSPLTGDFIFAERMDEPSIIDIYWKLKNAYDPSKAGNGFLFVRVRNRYLPYDSKNPEHGFKNVYLKDNRNRYHKCGFVTEGHPTLSNLRERSYLLSRVKYIEIRNQPEYKVVRQVSAEWPADDFRALVKQVIVHEEGE